MFYTKIFRRKINILPYFLILTLSFLYALFIFDKVPEDSFLLVHDHATWVSKKALFHDSFIISNMNFGLNMPVQFVTNLSGRSLYSILYAFNLNLRSIQFITLVFFNFFLQSLAFFGIGKIYRKVNKKDNVLDILLLTLFYCINPLIVVFMSTGNYWNLNFLITYSLLPLLIYTLVNFYTSDNNKIVDVLLLTLLLSLSVFYIPFNVPIFLIALVFLLFNTSLKRITDYTFRKHIVLVVLFLLVCSPMIYSYYLAYAGSYKGIIKEGLLDSTAGALRGGVMNMMLNYFSWTIYTIWTPRSILHFHRYFKSFLFVLSSLSLYSIVLLYKVKDSGNSKFFNASLLTLVASIFLGKGPQNPFGFIYDFLVNNIPLFQVLRSPDNKFSIGIIFSLMFILLIILGKMRKDRKVLFYLYLLTYVVIVSFPFFNGEAIIGKNIRNVSGDFVTKIYQEYDEVVEILDSDNKHYGVLVYPPSTLPVTLDKEDNIFIGKDVVGLSSKLPFYYLSVNALTEPGLLELLKNIYYDFDFEILKNISAGYVLIRKDMYKSRWSIIAEEVRGRLDSNPDFQRVLSNDIYDLYSVPSYLSREAFSMECVGGESISYEYVSPVYYKLNIFTTNWPCNIIYMGMHNDFWKFFALPIEYNGILSGLPRPLSVEKISSTYPNVWAVTPHSVNMLPRDYVENIEDGESLNLVMFYLPQLYMNFFVILSTSILLFCLFYVFIKRRKCNILSS